MRQSAEVRCTILLCSLVLSASCEPEPLVQQEVSGASHESPREASRVQSPLEDRSPAVPAAELPFRVGDHVVLTPTVVSVVTSIGPRSRLVPADSVAVDVNAERLLDGEPMLREVDAENDPIVYALAFAYGDEREPYALLPVDEAIERGLRPAATSEEVTELLAALTNPAPAPPSREPLLFRLHEAGSDLQRLAAAYASLGSDDESAHQRPRLRRFFVEEVRHARDLSEEDAEAVIAEALGPPRDGD